MNKNLESAKTYLIALSHDYDIYASKDPELVTEERKKFVLNDIELVCKNLDIIKKAVQAD